MIDQVVVVDDSTDGTAEIARALGAEVFDQEQLAPELGPVLGKGDAMWRALPALTGEVVCFLDADYRALRRPFRVWAARTAAVRTGRARVRQGASTAARSRSASRRCPTAEAGSPSSRHDRC